LVVVTTICLSLKFQLKEMSLYIDRDIYVIVFDDLIHTISQSLVYNGDGRYWLLRPKRFRLYNLSEFVVAVCTRLATSFYLPSCTIQTPLTSRVKVEPCV
jgi:hypothetical protein